MDAFPHFLTELALWNLLLATLAFLFGLLMGHWMWGQFKRKFLRANQDLRQSEGQLLNLIEENSKLKEKKTNQEREDRSASSHEEKQNEKFRAQEQEKKLQRSLTIAEETIAKNESQIASLEKELSENKLRTEEALTKAKLAKKSSTNEPKDEESSSSSKLAQKEKKWRQEKEEMAQQLTKEKAEGESLQRRMASLVARGKDLEEKLVNLREQLKKGKN